MSQQKSQEQQRVQKALGEQIRNLRLKKRRSQTTLAELSGLSVPAISQIVRGVTLSTLVALVGAFRITISQLFQGVA
jgi:transcriptional regulator with XRE-family HTH domain